VATFFHLDLCWSSLRVLSHPQLKKRLIRGQSVWSYIGRKKKKTWCLHSISMKWSWVYRVVENTYYEVIRAGNASHLFHISRKKTILSSTTWSANVNWFNGGNSIGHDPPYKRVKNLQVNSFKLTCKDINKWF